MTMEQPSWKHILSYETKWMSRDEIVESSYDAAIELNRMRIDFGLVSRRKALKTEKRMMQARETVKLIDDIMKIEDENERERELDALRSRVHKLSENTICDKKDLEWPVKFIRMRLGWIVKNWWHIEVVHRFHDLMVRFRGDSTKISHLARK
jgi:hypothetical protein